MMHPKLLNRGRLPVAAVMLGALLVGYTALPDALGSPTPATMTEAMGGACYYVYCGGSPVCSPMGGGLYRKYYYKLGVLTYAKNPPTAGPNCIEVYDEYPNGTCTGGSPRYNNDLSYDTNGCP